MDGNGKSHSPVSSAQDEKKEGDQQQRDIAQHLDGRAQQLPHTLFEGEEGDLKRDEVITNSNYPSSKP